MDRFDGKVVAITGAAGGIGQALCRHFGELGAAIAALDRKDAVTEVAQGLERDGIRCVSAVADISLEAQVAGAFAGFAETLGPVDILVNNAGVSNHRSVEKTTPQEWQSDVHANVNGAYNCVKAVLPAMKQRRGGAIVNIATVNGLAFYGDPAYSAGKAGMISLTKSLAVEYGRYGIRTNAICPGTVRTPVWTRRMADQPDILAKLTRWYPLGRVVDPTDVAKAAGFLASDAAAAITGAVLPVDCGLTAGNIVMSRDLTGEEY